MTETRLFTILALCAAMAAAACSGREPARVDSNNTKSTVNSAQPEQTPKSEGTVTAESSPTGSDASKAPALPQGFTEADLEKIKWLEGTWRGSYKTFEFYERISFKGSRIMIETFTDGTLKKKGPPASFELKNGELTHTVGDEKWTAVSVTEDAVQFVPAAEPKPGENGKASFRFERQPGNTWRAILDTPETATKPPLTKVYKMEPWSAPAK